MSVLNYESSAHSEVPTRKMSIDPKYANLPGIDLDSRDCYETSDLPESDQVELEDPDGESVEKINVSPSDAFTKFKGTKIGDGEIDFSDRVGKNRRTGYHIPQSEYEILPGGTQIETPQQKYQRLQHELRELVDEVNQIRDNAKADANIDNVSPVQLTKQAEYLQHQLGDLHLDKLLGDGAEVNLVDPQGALQKRLLSEITSFKQPAAKDPKATAAAAVSVADGEHVKYQLYYKPEQAKFSNNARMADLEERIERLEALLGNNPSKLSALTGDTSSKTLVSAVAILSAKTKLLDTAQLDQVEGRLLAVNQKFSQVLDKKEAIADAEKQNKIAELYAIVKKWEGLADSVPNVVDRLTALKGLHEQALQLSQALAHLDTSQQQIAGHLTAHSDMLKQVSTTLGENMAVIKSNCEHLDSRIKTIQK